MQRLGLDDERVGRAGRVHFVENAPLTASATEVRRRLAAREAIPDGWLSPRVVRYLSKYRLYL